jgi:hypothetical protein
MSGHPRRTGVNITLAPQSSRLRGAQAVVGEARLSPRRTASVLHMGRSRWSGVAWRPYWLGGLAGGGAGLSGRDAECFGMGAAVVLGQGLAEGAGAVGDGAVADLAADEGQVGNGDREAAGLCLAHLLLLCHPFPAASDPWLRLACVPRQMKMSGMDERDCDGCQLFAEAVGAAGGWSGKTACRSALHGISILPASAKTRKK